MLRRDYIMRMIEEFIQSLARIRSLKREQQWDEAATDLETQSRRLTRADLSDLLVLSDTDLWTRIIEGEPTQAIRDKILLTSALLAEAGDVATAQDRTAAARDYYRKALQLLLTIQSEADSPACPDYVPTVERLVLSLEPDQVPLNTGLLLVQHYERLEQFAKAEDQLYRLLESNPEIQALRTLAIAFCERLLAHEDDTLNRGGLPRTEIEESLRQLKAVGS